MDTAATLAVVPPGRAPRRQPEIAVCVERRGLPTAPGRTGSGGVATELEKARLVGMQPQTELFREPLAKISKELLRIGLGA